MCVCVRVGDNWSIVAADSRDIQPNLAFSPPYSNGYSFYLLFIPNLENKTVQCWRGRGSDFKEEPV